MLIKIVLSLYVFFGLLSFILFGVDKYKAIKGKYRISEAMLLASGALFGCYGMIMGMLIFNHKTKKTKFRVIVPIIFSVHTCIWLFISMNPNTINTLF